MTYIGCEKNEKGFPSYEQHIIVSWTSRSHRSSQVDEIDARRLPLDKTHFHYAPRNAAKRRITYRGVKDRNGSGGQFLDIQSTIVLETYPAMNFSCSTLKGELCVADNVHKNHSGTGFPGETVEECLKLAGLILDVRLL